MAEHIQKNDFIELEFTGRTKEGNIFDTNLKEEAKKINLEIETRPLVIIIGQGMILPSIDSFLEGKELGKYTLELSPEKAFGQRHREMIKTMPFKIFLEKQVYPQAGMVFQFDNMLGKITAVSGGRVIVDFNNPLAGKDVVYELNAKREISDINEKAGVLILSLFGRKLDFSINEGKIIVKLEKKFAPIVEFFKPRFKEILNLELGYEEIPEEKEEKREVKEEKKD